MIELLNSYRSGSISKKEEKLFFSELRDCLRNIVLKINKKYRTISKVEKYQTLDDIINDLIVRVVEKKIPSKKSSITSDTKLKSYLYKTVENEFKRLYNNAKKNHTTTISDDIEEIYGDEDPRFKNLLAGAGYKEYLHPRARRLDSIKKLEDCLNLIKRKFSETRMTFSLMIERWPNDYGNNNSDSLKKQHFDCRSKILKHLFN
jgi:DNA-directed RNA polymerase specialized sigma24 family protein